MIDWFFSSESMRISWCKNSGMGWSVGMKSKVEEHEGSLFPCCAACFPPSFEIAFAFDSVLFESVVDDIERVCVEWNSYCVSSTICIWR